MECRPRAAFDELFDRGTPCGAGDAHTAASTSVLDLVAADAARLRKRLGPADRAVLGDYLETVRDVERRVDRSNHRAPEPEGRGEVEQRFVERLALMFDLIALAFRADITRVASVMMAAEASAMTYDHLGVSEPFHLLSHHQNDPGEDREARSHPGLPHADVRDFIRTLAELPDGDGSILDRSLILFGSNMSDSHAHDHFPLPLAVVGGGCGARLGWPASALPDRTPISNLLLTVLRRAGVPVQSIGDSTGECGEV